VRDQLKKHIAEVITLSDSEMTEFVNLFSETRLSKRSMLVSPGDVVTQEYYVLKGCLKAYYLDQYGEKHIIQFAIEDWWISDFEAFFGQKPAKLYVEAIEDSVLLAIDNKILETLYQRIPKFERFFRIKTTRAFLSSQKRILSTLEKTAAERYIDFCSTYPFIEKRIANYHIANYLGIKPESLSRIRRQLEVAS